MIPVFEVFFYDQPQLRFRRNDHFVKTLCLDCSDKVFHPCIHLRRKRRQFLDGNPDGFKNGIEPLIEKAVAVVNQLLLAEKKAIPHIAHISGYLRCPVAVRRMNDAAKPNFTAANVHEKQ